MEAIDSKCYHVGAAISTATVGTQSGIGSSIVNANNGNNNNNSNNNSSNSANGTSNSNNSGNGSNGSGGSNTCGTNTSNEELALATCKSKAQLNSGNYLNIVPMSMGVQYHHRRKYSPQIQSDYQSSRIFFGGAGDYVSRERCREDYYTLASTPIPLSDVELGGNILCNGSAIPSPLSMAVQQQQQQQQQSQLSPLPPQSNVPSVLYTVQRVITTSQIQTSGPYVDSNMADNRNAQDMLECSNGDTGMHLTGGGSGGGGAGGCGVSSIPCSNNANYQAHTHQIVSHSSDTQTHISNGYGTPSNSSSSITRPLQNVIPTCVYLMSRIAVHMEIEGTAHCPSQVVLAAALGCEELGIANKLLAQSVFGVWMTSSLLELQLKPHNRPFAIRSAWSTKLLPKYSSANALQKKYDEPMIQLRRSVFMAKRDEEKIKDPRIIELLYEEARHNVLAGRYILEPAHSIMLGGIQARIELGPFNVHSHTIGYFREHQFRFLPQHVAKNTNWSWMPYSRKTSAEVKLLEQYKRVPSTATTRKLMRKYLEFCWALPFYGSAYFQAQIEQPVRGLMSLFNQKDIAVLVAINERGIFIIDQINSTLLLGLKYEELSWDFAKPSAMDDDDCLPCIFIQFDAVENGMSVSKMMQVFSKQAPMMDALISHFAEQMRRRREGENGQPPESLIDEPNPIQNNGCGVLSNKLSRLTLATFDEDGRCIGQMGSLSISY